MLYHEKERKNEDYEKFVHIVYLLAKLCNIFDEAFLLTSVYFNISFLVLCIIHIFMSSCLLNET